MVEVADPEVDRAVVHHPYLQRMVSYFLLTYVPDMKVDLTAEMYNKMMRDFIDKGTDEKLCMEISEDGLTYTVAIR